MPSGESASDNSPPTAPADIDRPHSRWERLAWYASTTILAWLIVVAGFRLDETDITAPFSYDGDTLLILPLVKSTLERGGHWRNERLGYPGIQELHDFPIIDHLHLAIIWMLGQVIPNFVVVYNLYFLLTWPLCALTGMVALRQLRLTLPAAAVGGLLFAFMPYHFMRGESHYFLSAYWLIPISWLPALAICRGDFPFFHRDPEGRFHWRLKSWHTLWQVVLGAATASAGAYYAFFACAIYGFVGAYMWVATRNWRAAVSAGILVGLVTLFGIVNHYPTFGYIAANGRSNVTDRFPEEAESYGLKFAHLVLPIDDHNITILARMKSRYNTGNRPLNNENTCASLGIIGATGLVGLVVMLLLPGRRGWPFGPLASLTGFLLLFALVSGFGSVFNLLVFDQIRCYNRFSIYIAFTCLFVVLWPLDRYLLTLTGKGRLARYPAFVLLALIGLLDQTPSAWFRQHIVRNVHKEAERYHADHRFFAKVEEQVGPGAKVFTVPYIPYPEVPPINGMNTYDQARGYLHTDTLVWSYGAMKNREADAWQRHVAYGGTSELLRRIVVRGFDGLFVDKRGFITTDRNQGDVVIDEIRREAERHGAIKIPMVTHEDGMQVFLDMRPYRDWLKKQDPIQFEQWSQREAEWATILWLRGFNTTDPHGLNDRFRWGDRSATAVIVNPADRTRRFELTATFGSDHQGEFKVWVDGGKLLWLNKPGGEGPWSDEITFVREPGAWDPGVRNYGVIRRYFLEIPPGRHTVKFRCQPPALFMPGDSRDKCFFLNNISFVEIK